MDQSDTDRDDIDYYFTILLVFISSITDETVLIRNGYSFSRKNKLLCISVYYQTGRENTPCVWRYNSYYGSRYLFNLMFSALLAYPLSVKTLPYRRQITFFVFFTMLFNGGLVPTYLMYVNYFI